MKYVSIHTSVRSTLTSRLGICIRQIPHQNAFTGFSVKCLQFYNPFLFSIIWWRSKKIFPSNFIRFVCWERTDFIFILILSILLVALFWMYVVQNLKKNKYIYICQNWYFRLYLQIHMSWWNLWLQFCGLCCNENIIISLIEILCSHGSYSIKSSEWWS